VPHRARHEPQALVVPRENYHPRGRGARVHREAAAVRVLVLPAVAIIALVAWCLRKALIEPVATARPTGTGDGLVVACAAPGSSEPGRPHLPRRPPGSGPTRRSSHGCDSRWRSRRRSRPCGSCSGGQRVTTRESMRTA
jgi:hypothetical protein